VSLIVEIYGDVSVMGRDWRKNDLGLGNLGF